MNHIDRYLLKTLIQKTLGALLILLLLDLVVEISSEADRFDAHYTLRVLLQTFAVNLPNKIHLYLPAALLLGSLLGFGQHAAHNELSLLQASGCSQWRLVRSGLLWALLMGIAAMALVEYAPRPQTTTNPKALWLHDGEQIVHIAEQNEQQLRHLTFYRAQPLSLGYAESAWWDGQQWQLQHAYTVQLNHQQLTPPQALHTWQSAFTPEHIHELGQRQRARSLRQQRQLLKLLEHYAIDHHREAVFYFRQLCYPLTTLTMLLLALPFVFGHSRFGGQGKALLLGILLGLSYYLVQGMFSNLALLLRWSPWLAAIMPNLLFASYPLWRLRRQ